MSNSENETKANIPDTHVLHDQLTRSWFGNHVRWDDEVFQITDGDAVPALPAGDSPQTEPEGS